MASTSLRDLLESTHSGPPIFRIRRAIPDVQTYRQRPPLPVADFEDVELNAGKLTSDVSATRLRLPDHVRE